jgi:hypothetical protein
VYGANFAFGSLVEIGARDKPRIMLVLTRVDGG